MPADDERTEPPIALGAGREVAVLRPLLPGWRGGWASLRVELPGLYPRLLGTELPGRVLPGWFVAGREGE